MSWFVIIGLSVVGLIWVIGSFHALDDLLENGKSLKDYRAKYGKDLGFLICATYRGMWFTIWPVVGLAGFIFGVFRDLFFYKGTTK